MTLKEKFDDYTYYNPFGTESENTLEREENNIECEKIADDFAIGFGQWMASGVEFMDDTERGRVYYFKKQLYTTQELLELYKKEKGL